MALTEDQRALLQLLLDGGQSYADIGSLLGVDSSEVRTRARLALTEIGGADPDAQVGLTDYLLGQADPIGRADAARHLQNDPAASALAARLAAQLKLLAPSARLPELPAAAAQAAPAGATATATAPSAARSAVERIGGAAAGLGSRKRRLPVALGVVGLLVLVVVLLATGVIGGSDDGTPTPSTATNATAGEVAVVSLEPQGGSKAGGQATFTVAQDQPVLQINLFGLAPNGPDDTYIVSLYRSDDQTLPIARSNADQDGNLTGATALPAQVGGTLGPNGFNQIDVSLASNSETAKALKTATNAKRLPKRSGTSVLRGNIPASAAAIASSAAGAATSTSTNPTSTTPTPTNPTSTTP